MIFLKCFLPRPPPPTVEGLATALHLVLCFCYNDELFS